MLPVLVAVPFIGALLPPLFKSRLRLDPGLAAGLVAGLALLCLVTLTPGAFRGETLVVEWQWLPAIGLALAFRLDGLGMLFAYLIVGIGILVVLGFEVVDPSLRAVVSVCLLLVVRPLVSKGKERAQRYSAQSANSGDSLVEINHRLMPRDYGRLFYRARF